jgi:hypothetical protein
MVRENGSTLCNLMEGEPPTPMDWIDSGLVQCGHSLRRELLTDQQGRRYRGAAHPAALGRVPYRTLNQRMLAPHGACVSGIGLVFS